MTIPRMLDTEPAGFCHPGGDHCDVPSALFPRPASDATANTPDDTTRPVD
jgi:hypothetical protein